MSNFNNLTDQEKKLHHIELLECADSIGGKNFFLQLLEAIRETKPHVLVSDNMVFETKVAIVSWSKVIFNDKLQLLLKARQNEREQDNLLPKEEEKNYKKILNVVRTLKPIVFHVKPIDPKDGDGFSLQPFDVISESKTKLNPVFDALFFSSVENVKKILNNT